MSKSFNIINNEIIYFMVIFMKKFTSIQQFQQAVKQMQLTCDYHNETSESGSDCVEMPIIEYSGTVKLHGSNLGLRRHNGQFIPQSRTQVLGGDNDCYGFAAHIRSIPESELHSMFDQVYGTSSDVTIFGEWIGPGIQRKVAVNEFPNKQWVLFGAWDDNAQQYIKIPRGVEIPNHHIYNIGRVPTFSITIDFKNPGDVLEELETLTLKVEEQCPWGKQFGIEGVGEGIVWTPTTNYHDSQLWFKVKGSRHKRGNNTHQKETLDPIVHRNVTTLIELILPEDRLFQGLEHLSELGLPVDLKSTGSYLKWINTDIRKEEMHHVDASEFDWKFLVPGVNERAKRFFFEQCNKACVMSLT